MRPKCSCGEIAGYWYGPVIYQKLSYEEYLEAHAFCAGCADTDNWGEYEYIGFHKKAWQWLKKKETQAYVLERNERLSKPYYDVSHLKGDIRWAVGRYYSMEKVLQVTEGLEGVQIKEGWYP